MLWSRFKTNKKGVTLIELIVAMALTAIVLTAATRIMIPMYRLYNDNLNQSNAIRVSSEIEKELRKRITSSVELSVSESATLDPTRTGYNYMYIENNRVKYDENIDGVVHSYNLMSEEAYEGYDVSWVIKPTYLRFYLGNESILIHNELKIYITLSNEDTTVTRLAAIQLINMLEQKDYFYDPFPNTPGLSRIFLVEYQTGLTIKDGGTPISYNQTGSTIQINGQITNEIVITNPNGELLYEGPRSIYEGMTGAKKIPSSEIDYYSIRYRIQT